MFRYALFSLFILTTSQLFAQEKPNVLMIVLDDLNDYVGVLDGHPQAKPLTLIGFLKKEFCLQTHMPMSQYVNHPEQVL